MADMKTSNFIIAAMVALLGAAVCLLSQGFAPASGNGDPGSGFWPTILGVALIVLSVLLVIFTLLDASAEKAKTFALTSNGNRLTYAFMGLSVLFCLVLYFFGFFIAGLLFVPPAMYLMGERNKRRMLLTSVGIVLGMYLVFSVMLSTKLPMGLLFS